LDEENLRIEEETRSWVKRVVVGLNLCPFAAKPVADQQLYVHIVRGTMQTVDIILQQVLAQALVLAGHDEETGKKKKKPNRKPQSSEKASRSVDSSFSPDQEQLKYFDQVRAASPGGSVALRKFSDFLDESLARALL